MHTIPVTILDDFFENPDAVVEFANTLDFSVTGLYPGRRTKLLSEIAPQLERAVLDKFVSLFTFGATKLNCTMCFQKIPTNWGMGVPHNDDDCITGVIYLNKGIDGRNSGTSFFQNSLNVFPDVLGDEKYEAIRTGNNAEYPKIAERVRKDLVETVNVKTKFNRLLAFSGDMLHAENDFDTGTDERLTLIFFVTDWAIPNPPVSRAKSASYF